MTRVRVPAASVPISHRLELTIWIAPEERIGVIQEINVATKECQRVILVSSKFQLAQYFTELVRDYAPEFKDWEQLVEESFLPDESDASKCVAVSREVLPFLVKAISDYLNNLVAAWAGADRARELKEAQSAGCWSVTVIPLGPACRVAVIGGGDKIVMLLFNQHQLVKACQELVKINKGIAHDKAFKLFLQRTASYLLPGDPEAQDFTIARDAVAAFLSRVFFYWQQVHPDTRPLPSAEPN